MANKENIEKMSELLEQSLALIKQYNEMAEIENHDTRIGLIDASFDFADKKYEMAKEILEGSEEEPGEELIDSMVVDVKSEIKYNSPYWSTQFPGVSGYGWKPSGINC